MEALLKIRNILNLNGLLENKSCLDLNLELIDIKENINKLKDKLQKKEKYIKIENKIKKENIKLYEQNLIINKTEIEYEIKKINNQISEYQALLSEEQNKLDKIEKNNLDAEIDIVKENIDTLNNTLEFYKNELDNLLKIKEKTSRQLEQINQTINNLDKIESTKLLQIDIDNATPIIEKLDEYLELLKPINAKEQYLFFDLKNEPDENLINKIKKFYNKNLINQNLIEFLEKVKKEKTKLETKINNKQNYLSELNKINTTNKLEQKNLEYDLQYKIIINNIEQIELFVKNYEEEINENKQRQDKILDEIINNKSNSEEIKKINKEIKLLLDKNEKINKLIISLNNTITNLKKNKNSIEYLINNNKKELNKLASKESSLDTQELLKDKEKLNILSTIEIILSIHVEFNKGDYLNFELKDNNTKKQIIKWKDSDINLLENLKNPSFTDQIIDYLQDGE